MPLGRWLVGVLSRQALEVEDVDGGQGEAARPHPGQKRKSLVVQHPVEVGRQRVRRTADELFARPEVPGRRDADPVRSGPSTR